MHYFVHSIISRRRVEVFRKVLNNSTVSRTLQTDTSTSPIGLTQEIKQHRPVSTLILLRHGQSQWNGPEARFTGWYDIPLTVRGRVEAVSCGQLLRSRGFKASNIDVAFTSELERAHETCELALASMAGAEQETWDSSRIRRDWRLNERHYGAVQGLSKSDPELLAKYGEDVVRGWRRSMTEKPPPLTKNDEMYQPPPAPTTESLKDCQKRAVECFHSAIAPALFDEPTDSDKRTVVVVAHSNTIRALMASFDSVPDPLVSKLHVPNSVPILYRFERSTREPVSSRLQSVAGGSHARWLVSAENHTQVRDALQPGGMLTRAMFDAWDTDNDRRLTVAELEAGIGGLVKEYSNKRLDCVVLAVAKKICRELDMECKLNGSIDQKEFERRASEAFRGLQGEKIL